MQHLEIVRENPGMADPRVDGFTSRLPVWLGGRRNMLASDMEKGLAFPQSDQTSIRTQSGFYRLTSPFRSMAAVHGAQEEVSMNNIMRRQDITIYSSVAAGRIGSADSNDRRHATQDGAMVKKEVRQGSQVAGNGM